MKFLIFKTNEISVYGTAVVMSRDKHNKPEVLDRFDNYSQQNRFVHFKTKGTGQLNKTKNAVSDKVTLKSTCSL